jgi:hypothetical protein
MFPLEVTDRASNLNDQQANAAKVLGKSAHRRAIFEAIYDGKQRVKTQDDVHKATGLSYVRILQEGRRLIANHLVISQKVDGKIAFRKDPFYADHKGTILRLASDKKKLERFPTKTNPASRVATKTSILRYVSRAKNIIPISVDDVTSFSKVKRVAFGQQSKPIDERAFKEGVKRVIGERGEFVDWGGEKADLFTTKIRINGKRVPCAFAFKGKGKKGILKIKDLGKNGDQLLRLFQTEAEAFFVQYWDQIDPAVYELAQQLAIAKSAMNGRRIYFGIIDGDDTQRLIRAYSPQFKKRKSRKRAGK